MAKFIQICASENDLFGLDVDGVVYQYNFKTKQWVELGHGQPDVERLLAPERPALVAQSESEGHAAGLSRH